MRISLVLGVCAAGAVMSAGAAEAAGGQAVDVNASIVGTVKDETGAVLPGTTVTATSPVLQVGRVTAVTDERGEYRLASLPVGTYQVSYSLDGFQSVNRADLRLTSGFTARVDIVLKLGSVNEAITVAGASPIVDVSSTTTKTVLTRESLELVPSSRNGVQGILVQAPGVRTNLDVGGNTVGATPSFHAFGIDGQPWPTIEGVLTASPKQGAQSGDYQDYATMEEVQVRTMGNDAQMATNGVQLTAVLKSGGNAFHGSGWYSYTNHSLGGNNITPELAAQGIKDGSPIVTRWDLSGDVGGRIVPDKVWFYGAARDRRNENGVLGCVEDDGTTQCVSDQWQRFYTGKVSYQLSSTNKLIGYYQWNLKLLYSGASQLVPWDSRYEQNQPGHLGKVEWQHLFGNTAVASLQYGYWDWGGNFTAVVPGQGVTTRDLLTGKWTGEQAQSYFTPLFGGEFRHHVTGSLSWFLPNSWHGNHSLKAGFDFIPATIDWSFYNHGSGDYVELFNNGRPFELATYNNPVTPKTWDIYTGLYLQDNWALTSRLTLNLGVRFGRDDLYVPSQSRVAGPFAPAASFGSVQFPIWYTAVPRLHFAYDLAGDGKTVLKGGWGRFAHMHGVDEGEPTNPNERTLTTWRWNPPPGVRQYMPGQINFDPNGPAFVSETGGESGTALLNEIPYPGLEPPMTDELSISIERELVPSLAVRATGVYSRTHDVMRLLNTRRPPSAYSIPITQPIPGPDGKLTDAPGTSLTWYEYPTSLSGLANQVPELVNDPNATQQYTSVELAATKRLSNRWQFMGAYSLTRIRDPYRTNIGGGLDFPVSTMDPNAEIFSANNTNEWGIKASGAYLFPWSLLGSANYELRSGLPYARTALFTAPAGSAIPSIVLPVEPWGSEKYPNLHLLDLRAERTLNVGRAEKLALRLDVFNALNVSTVTAVSVQSNALFSVPSAIVPGRNVQFGLNFTF